MTQDASSASPQHTKKAFHAQSGYDKGKATSDGRGKYQNKSSAGFNFQFREEDTADFDVVVNFLDNTGSTAELLLVWFCSFWFYSPLYEAHRGDYPTPTTLAGETHGIYKVRPPIDSSAH